MLADETFWELFKSVGHWEFELFLMILFDFVIGYVVWQRLLKPHIHRDVQHAGHGHEPDENDHNGHRKLSKDEVERLAELEEAVRVATWHLDDGDAEVAWEVLTTIQSRRDGQ
jgi:hypothetical protein